MRVLSVVAVLGAVAFVGCNSRRDANLEQAQRNLAAIIQAQQDRLQWQLDDAVAARLFGDSQYLTFRKCHEDPPSHAANQKVCATLRGRVAKEEATSQTRALNDKAAW